MDLKQLNYIVKIADECSITKAAEQLYISQSGLNQQLLKLEHELGIQLFHRNKNELRLTEAGKVYVDYARQILLLKQEAYDILNDMVDNKVGKLTVGLTPERGINMFMDVYPKFYERYPMITVEPQEINVRTQQSLITKGYLDFGFVTLNESDKTNNEYIHIYYEDVLLAVSRSNPLAKHAAPPGQPYTTANFCDFRDEPFVVMPKNSTFRQIVDTAFENSGITPHILLETASNLTLCNMVKNNLACAVISENYARDADDVAYFYLPGRPLWELCASYKKGHYLTKAGKYFIELAIEYYHRVAAQTRQNFTGPF